MIRYAIRKVRASRNNNNASAAPGLNQDNDNQQPQPPEVSPGSDTPKEPIQEEPKRTRWQVWGPRLKLAAAILFPCLLETLDYTVVATSQTNIASIFNRLDLQSYIGTAYVLGSTVFLPAFASLADVFGRYVAMQISVITFLVGSSICTGAMSMPTLLVGRGISGIGAAGLLTIVRIILSDSISLDDNNAQGAIMIIAYTLGWTVGPVLGGVLLQTNWRWVFAINLPICTASIILMHLLLPSITKGPQPPQRLKRLPAELVEDLKARHSSSSKIVMVLKRLDLTGAALFVTAGILILLGLNWGSTQAWNQAKVIACMTVGGALLIVFISWEYIVDHSTDHLVVASSSPYNESDVEASGKEKSQATPKEGTRAQAARRFSPTWVQVMDPMIPMNMFRSYDIVATDFACMTSGMIMLGIFYFVSVFYVIVSGKDAVGAGVQLLYFAPGMGLGTLIALRLIKWLRQPKWPIILAHTILPIGTGLVGQALYTGNNGQIIGFMIMTGAGVGMGFGPLAYQARFGQPEDRVAIVIATNLFFRTLGGTIGLAQLSAVMYSRVRSYITNQIKSGHLSLADAGRIQASLGSVGHQTGILGLPDNLRSITTDAFRDGLRWAFLSLVPWMAVAWLLVLFLKPIDPKRLNQAPGQPLAKKPVEKEEEIAPKHEEN